MKRYRLVVIVVVLVAGVLLVFNFRQGLVLNRVLHYLFVKDDLRQKPAREKVLVQTMDGRSFNVTEGMRRILRTGANLGTEDCRAIAGEMYGPPTQPGDEVRLSPNLCSDEVVAEMQRRQQFITRNGYHDDPDLAWVAGAIRFADEEEKLSSAGWIDAETLHRAVAILNALSQASQSPEGEAAAFFKTIDEFTARRWVPERGRTVAQRTIAATGLSRLVNRARYYEKDGSWSMAEVFDLYVLRNQYPGESAAK